MIIAYKAIDNYSLKQQVIGSYLAIIVLFVKQDYSKQGLKKSIKTFLYSKKMEQTRCG